MKGFLAKEVVAKLISFQSSLVSHLQTKRESYLSKTGTKTTTATKNKQIKVDHRKSQKIRPSMDKPL